jgi:NADPH2 dehydrogenase
MAVVDAVHEAGSYIFLQLWALGRSADPDRKKQDGTGDVVSSSAVPQEGGPVPRALFENEIQQYIRDYAMAARNAVEAAGFDGTELRGGNGSLIDRFTQDCVNRREDRWGGIFEDRSRFAVEVTRGVCDAVGSNRVGFRITPFGTYNSMGMKDAVPQFSHLFQELENLSLACCHFVEVSDCWTGRCGTRRVAESSD